MADQKFVEILTPTGRLVSGHPMKEITTDQQNNPLVIKNGPNAGQPRSEYTVGIAIPKTDPAFPAFRAIIDAEASAAFPHLFTTGVCDNPAFSYKILDGDDTKPNTAGNRNCDKDGWPGHWVVFLSDGFPPACYTTGGAARITDMAMIQRGYYIRVSGSVKSNGNAQNPGLFLNMKMVELVAHGEVMQSGPDAKAVFAAPAAVPAGATAAPQVTTPPPAAVAPDPQVTTPPPAAPAAVPPPRPEILNGPGAAVPPPAAPAAPAAPVPTGPVMTDKAGGATYEACIAAGWTDATLIAAGMMLADKAF